MATSVKSFHIHDMIYDENTKKLTYNFEVNGLKYQRVCIDFNTPEAIAENFKTVLKQNYTVESES